MAKKPKITQEFQVFYKLYQAYKENQDRWVSTWEFVGEMFIKELNEWVLMSYKTPTNGLNIFFKNPGLVQREWFKGKSGSHYYQYRFAPGVNATLIKDKDMLEFYTLIKSKQTL